MAGKLFYLLSCFLIYFTHLHTCSLLNKNKLRLSGLHFGFFFFTLWGRNERSVSRTCWMCCGFARVKLGVWGREGVSLHTEVVMCSRSPPWSRETLGYWAGHSSCRSCSSCAAQMLSWGWHREVSASAQYPRKCSWLSSLGSHQPLCLG